jgi:hypothetical protein
MGSDDPAAVQAAKLSGLGPSSTPSPPRRRHKGVYMLSGYDDAYRVYSNNMAKQVGQ